MNDENMELATMYYDFIYDYSNMFNVKTFIDKEKAINDIVKELQSKNGTSDLINKLEIVIDDNV